MVAIRTANPAEIPQLSEFYRDTQYAGGVSSTDRLVVAERGSELVGVYRLAREQGVLVLRGMRVHPSVQRQGIGLRLLAQLNRLDEPCYCVPHSHLEPFYRFAGFLAVDEGEGPEFLQIRVAGYQARGLNCRLMSRDPAPWG